MERIEAALTELEDSERRYIEGLEQVTDPNHTPPRCTSRKPRCTKMLHISSAMPTVLISIILRIPSV